MFRAARGARSATLAGGADPALVDAADRRRRPLARTAPILLESPRLIDQAMRLQFDRAPSQIALIALMIVAFAVVALTRLSSGAEPIGSASPEASIRAGSPSSTPMPTLAATPSVGPSMLPSASPASSFRTTYKVMKGDTLGGIAKTYGTTTAKIRTLNGLTSNTLKIGQVLKIP